MHQHLCESARLLHLEAAYGRGGKDWHRTSLGTHHRPQLGASPLGAIARRALCRHSSHGRARGPDYRRRIPHALARDAAVLTTRIWTERPGLHRSHHAPRPRKGRRGCRHDTPRYHHRCCWPRISPHAARHTELDTASRIRAQDHRPAQRRYHRILWALF